MTEYLIGTGGWSYFKVPNKPSLKAYSEHFNFVEVNNTFYQYPSSRTVERWRQIVPDDFTFTVRCHQDLTHNIGLQPTDEAVEVFSRMIWICKILDAPFLHLLTPANYFFDDGKIGQARDFFSTVNWKGVQLAWEVRSTIIPKLSVLMQDMAIINSVDLSREQPTWKADTIYTRLFGKGRHNIYQFIDEELMEIDQKILKAEAKKAVVAYHGTKMIRDASRFKYYKEAGRFLPVTAFTGIDSVRAVLEEDAEFPCTKTELVKHQGWKVVDLTIEKRVRLSQILSKLHAEKYDKIQEVIEELEVSALE